MAHTKRTPDRCSIGTQRLKPTNTVRLQFICEARHVHIAVAIYQLSSSQTIGREVVRKCIHL